MSIKAPFLLAKAFEQNRCLSLIRKNDGTLFATAAGRRVPLKGIPASLSPLHLESAKKLFENRQLTLSWTGTAVLISPKLLGGGCCQSTLSEEQDPLLKAPLRVKKGTLTVPFSGKIDVAVEQATSPHRNIPKKNSSFTGRESMLTEIKKLFTEGEGAITEVCLAGLGGVGKTSLAIEYLHRNQDRYNVVWWISGEQPMGGYRDLGEALGIINSGEKEVNLVEKVKTWLEQNPNWLLVFDNVDNFQQLSHFLPLGGKNGHILTTSRNSHVKNCLVIDVFSPDESIDLLTSLTGQNNRADAAKLAEALGHLPLALTQAGAYIKETSTSFSDYQRLFVEERQSLWNDESAPKDYPATVQTTWNISVKRIRSEMPEALELLYRSSFLAPDNIPKLLFRSEEDYYSKTEEEPLALAQGLNKLQAYSLFTIGQKEGTYSVHRLVQASTRDSLSSGDTKVVLQSILYYCLMRDWRFNQDMPSLWPKATLLRSHLESFCHYGVQIEEFWHDIASFYRDLGIYHQIVQIDLHLANEYLIISWALNEQVYGEESDEVAGSLSDLGAAFSSQGKHGLAVYCTRGAYQIKEKSSGINNAGNIGILANLGGIMANEGDFQLAMDYSSKAVALSKLRYGDNHPAYATCLSNLASTLMQQGNLQEAIEYFKQTLAIYRKSSGENNPHVASSLNYLALCYGSQKDFPTAIDHYHQALEIYRKAHGEEHPKVATVLNNLSTIHYKQGDFTSAIDLLGKAKAIIKKTYGNEHLDAASVASNLGLVYKDQGNFSLASICLTEAVEILKKLRTNEDDPSIAFHYEQLGAIHLEKNTQLAIDYFKKAMQIRKNLKGDLYPDLAADLNNLGEAYLIQNNFALAIDSFHQSLAQLKKASNEESHATSKVFCNLGRAYAFQGNNLSLAIDAFSSSLTIFKKLCGEEYPFACALLDNIGKIHAGQNKPDMAVNYFVQALTIRRKIHPDEQIHITISLDNLAEFYQHQGNLERAIDYYEQSLSIKKKVLDPTDTKVTLTLNNLGMVFSAQGNLKRAIDCLSEALLIEKNTHSEEDEQVASILNNLGVVHYQHGNNPSAIAYFKHSLEIREKVLNEGHPDISTSLNNLKMAEQTTRRTLVEIYDDL